MCQRWAANAIKIKASRLHCPLRQHWRPGGNGKETLSRPRWLPFFSFYSIHTPSVRLFHQHKMRKKKKRITTSKSVRLSQQRIASQRTNKNFEFFFLRKISFVCKQNTTNVVSGSEASWGSGTLRFCGGCRTRAHKNIPFTHTHTQTLRLENIDLQSFVSTNEHYASFFKVHNQPATWLLFKHHQSAAAFLLAKLFFFFFSSQRPFPVRPHGGLFIPANGSIVCDDCNSILLRRLTWTFHFWVGSWGQSTGLGRSILC